MMLPEAGRDQPIVPVQKSRRVRERLTRKRRRGRLRRIPPATVPSFFTLMNLFCGFVSLVQSLEGRYDYACWLIVLAGFFDALDGMMARLTNSSSVFGVELDSLSDMVSFGVAPAFLVYVFALRDAGMVGLIVAAMPAICGAVRLARFNVSHEDGAGDSFVGLPIPAAAIVLVAMMLNVDEIRWIEEFSISGQSIFAPTLIVLAGLMVSTIRFDKLPRPSARFVRTHRVQAVGYLVSIVLVIVFHQVGLLISLIAYLVHGVGRALVAFVRALVAPDDSQTTNGQAV